MSLVELFKDWVAKQPPQTTIDHHSYESCALGVFAHHYNHNEHINHDADHIQGWDVAHSLHQVYGDEPYATIGNGGRETSVNKAAAMATYGELSVWLNSLTPVGASGLMQ